MLDAETLARLQRLRHARDVADGDALRPSPDRLKARALELTVCLGRLARDPDLRPTPALVSDVLMGALGAANLVRLDLSRLPPAAPPTGDALHGLAGAIGPLADAAEKIDHLEEFAPLARSAIPSIVAWCASVSDAIRVGEIGGAPPRILARLAAAHAPSEARSSVA